jgi:Reverse transcriptase (RNA-dependent DNA polymerase)
VVDINNHDDGGAETQRVYWGATVPGTVDLSTSHDTFADFLSFLASTSFPDHIETTSLDMLEPKIFWNHSLSVVSSFRQHTRTYDLSKEPQSYTEAITRPDADAWHAAMDREKESLEQMGTFKEVELPPGERVIGLKWVYAYKMNAEGVNIKEKARVVAQEFNQRPGQFGETYAPVAKMASICILLTWAAIRDLKIFQFDCKTAFLHAKLRHPIYARQFPGYTLVDPIKVL